MRLTVFFLFITAFLSVHATGKAQKVTLSGKDLTLKEVFLAIEKQTGYVVFYNRAMLPEAGNISLTVTAVPVPDLLNMVLKNQQLDFVIQDKTISISRSTPVKVQPAQDDAVIIMSGPLITLHVTDSVGNPLAGASVLLKTGQASGITDARGMVTLEANEGDFILVSFVGHETRSIPVTRAMLRNGTLTIVLHTAAFKLGNVDVIVNTGYQRLSRERATGSFSKPDMQVFANRISTMDLVGRLEGQIPGMIVMQDNGDPYTNSTITNNTATKVQTVRAFVRGTNSINASTQPLYVVNGIVVQDFSALNLDDVADVTVLKDAAASAIWGAQAANGVIVVTTKSGAKNQQLKIGYSGFVNVQGRPDFNYVRKRYLSSRQYIDVSKQLFDPSDYPYDQFNNIYNYYVITPSLQVLYDQDRGLLSAADANAKLDSMAGIDNTKQVEDLLFSNAVTTNHTISASGGNKYYNVYGSLGYNYSQGTTPGTTNSVYRINLSQTFTPNDRFTFSLNSTVSENISKNKGNTQVEGDVLPYQLFRDAKGNNINMPYLSYMTPDVIRQYSAASGIDLGTYSPLDEVNYVHSKNDFYTLNLVGNAGIKIWKGISFQGTYGYSATPTNSVSTTDNQSFNYRRQLVNNTMPGNPPTYLIPVTGQLYRGSNNNQSTWTVRNQLVYNYSGRNGKDVLSLQGGQEANEVRTNTRSSVIYGWDPQLESYPLIDYNTLSKGVSGTVGGYGGNLQKPTSVHEVVTRYSSYFGLASYTLNRKYSIDGSWRVDHSNLFGSDVSSQNKPAYSVGAKWNMKREHFLNNVNWLNALALRATYGVAGNSPYVGSATVYDVLYNEQIPNYNYPVIGGPATNLSSPANSRLSWEATHTLNIGVDFGVLDNRLTGSVDYYRKKTNDLLGYAPTNYFTGFLSVYSNIGDLVNNGLNIGLNSTNIHNKNFTWTTGFVFGFNQNKLVTFELPDSYSNTASFKLQSNGRILGYSLNSLFAYKYAGLNDQGDPQIKLADGKITSDPNAPMGKDVVYKGTVTPRFSGGFTNYFAYKQFGLSLNMIYNLGDVMRLDANQTYNGSPFFNGLLAGTTSAGGNISVDFLKRWQKPGDEKTTNIPRYLPVDYGDSRNTQYYQYGDINVVSAAYVKLREAAFSYTLSPSVVHMLKIESAVLRFQVNNILLWKANKEGIDPEYHDFYGGQRVMPLGQHSISFGANINF